MESAEGDDAAVLSYTELITRLFPRLTGGIRWGLDRVENLLAEAGDPHRSFRAIHVAGTNGKGSVAATAASVLQRAGYRVGLYSSPHLCSFRERIRIDGDPISAEDLLATARPLWPALEASGASFFEATTVLAFSAFARAGIDVGVIEVGLGGRLDATNVLDPDVAVITNIALDHREYLGDTIESVAREKAGIIKPGRPVVTAEVEGAAADVFRSVAARINAPIDRVAAPDSVRYDLSGTRLRLVDGRFAGLRLRTPLIGEHQAHNTAIAVRALEHFGIADETVIQAGVAAVHWPGRLQVLATSGCTWVFDVAHNVAGVDALVRSFATLNVPKPVVVLIGILGDKDWRRMLPPLFAAADVAILTVPPTAPAGRAWCPSEAVSSVPGANTRVIDDFEVALCAARTAAAGGTVLVTGSFHTVGDAIALLGDAGVEPDLPLHANVFSG